MCGLSGIFDRTGARDIDRALLARMNDSMTHRGPDESGIFTAPGIGLAHRRLSIIDLSSGQQPMHSADGALTVVFNGEIYNYQDLRAELSGMGYVFRTKSDTEVILHGWEAWGERCVDRFTGMFAFALWDSRQHSLFLARDRFGEKPLYYAALADGAVIFGSELKSLMQHPGLKRAIDPSAVEDYFAFGYINDPKTIFSGVQKLPPAHRVIWRRGQNLPAPQPYWDISFQNGHRDKPEDLAHELIERLRAVTRRQMVSEVPLGAFLSGGVDSSAVVAMMAGLSDQPVNTCSIGFDAPDYDESAYAAQVAQRYHTNHFTQIVDPDSFDLVDRLASMYDEPFADSSAMPTYRVCALARQRVTVALSGDAGDEIFAGYRRYNLYNNTQSVREKMPQAFRSLLFGFLGEVYPKADWAPRVFRAKTTFQELAMDPVQAYVHAISVLPRALRLKLYSPAFTQSLQGYNGGDMLDKIMRGAPADDALSRVQYGDMKTYLPGDILTKVDRASMASSLEVRVPMLDHTFAEWAVKIPVGLRLRGGEGKYIFKKALEPYLPNDTLYRKKMGFAVPLANWFRGPLKARLRQILTSPYLSGSGFFDMNYVTQLVDQHQAGLRDYSAPLWQLLMFESALRQYEEGAAPVPVIARAAAL